MRTIAAYLAERFPLQVFGPALALMAGATAWTANDVSGATMLQISVLGAMLLAQFRVWDDVEDVDRDRESHPERVMVNAPPGPFRWLLAALFLATAVVCLQHPAALAVLVALESAMWCGYRRLRARLSDETWRFGVLLLKYPAFILVMGLVAGTTMPSRLAVSAAAAYACASAYERWHHGRPRLGVSS